MIVRSEFLERTEVTDPRSGWGPMVSSGSPMNHALAILAVATGSLAALLSLGWWVLAIRGPLLPAAFLASAATVYALFALPFGIALRWTPAARAVASELTPDSPRRFPEQFGLRVRGGGRVRFLSPVFVLVTVLWWIAAAVSWVCNGGNGHELQVTVIPLAFAVVMSLGILAELLRRATR